MQTKKKKHRNCKYEKEPLWESDENFAVIIGYTSGGAPYGVMWEEFKKFEETDEEKVVTDEDIPF